MSIAAATNVSRSRVGEDVFYLQDLSFKKILLKKGEYLPVGSAWLQKLDKFFERGISEAPVFVLVELAKHWPHKVHSKVVEFC